MRINDAFDAREASAIAPSFDDALRIRYALEGYRGTLADALLRRYKAEGDSSACASLREGLTATDAHITRVCEAIARAWLQTEDTSVT